MDLDRGGAWIARFTEQVPWDHSKSMEGPVNIARLSSNANSFLYTNISSLSGELESVRA